MKSTQESRSSGAAFLRTVRSHFIIGTTLIIVAAIAIGLSFLATQQDTASSRGDQVPQARLNPVDQERLLIGGWQLFVGDPADPDCSRASADTACEPNDTRELDFEMQNGSPVFNSYLHHRPEMTDCKWQAAQDMSTITVQCGNSIPNTIFTVSNIDSYSITLSEDGGPSAKYMRIPASTGVSQ